MNTFFSKNSPFFYLYRKTTANRIKRALKKPLTYIYGILIIGYFFLVFVGFGTMFKDIKIDSPSIVTAFLTVMTFTFTPANLISYSKKKGLLFKPSDIHFLFTSPVSPKRILLYAHIKTILMSFVLNFVLAVGGALWFNLPIWKVTVFFLFAAVIENILEASLMILCYGNERLNKKQMNILQIGMYALIGSFVVIGIVMYITEGASFQVVLDYLHSPAIQVVPIIGWYIAFIHLLFMGPTTVNVICSILFFGSVIFLFICAMRMKCSGEYFEDATKFADDYEEARQKGKKGEVAITGWKQKYGKATVTYKGSYAKAIFYRQLLEYKKNRFFIFGFYTLLCAAIGIGMAMVGQGEDFGEFAPFVILGAMAYLTFIFSSYSGKWGKELEKPYTYLLPDSTFHKLWYATLIEHIRAVIDGCLIAVPTAVVLRIPFLSTVMIIAIYVCLQACKLYSAVMVEAFLGNILGMVGKQFARLFFEGLVISMGILGAFLGTILVSMEVGFFVLIIISVVMTVGMMVVAAVNFERMETLV